MKMVSYQVVDKNGKPYVQVKVGDENKVRQGPISRSWLYPTTSPLYRCNIYSILPGIIPAVSLVLAYVMHL